MSLGRRINLGLWKFVVFGTLDLDCVQIILEKKSVWLTSRKYEDTRPKKVLRDLKGNLFEPQKLLFN